MGRNKVIGGGGFHHLAIKVADFDGAVKFYTEGLGFVVAARWGDGDGRAILLDTGDGNYFELFAGGKPSAEAAGPFVHVALRSDNVDAALARAKAAGAVVTMEPKDVDIPSTPPLPVRIAFCKAPGGEVLEFFCHRKG
jgi:glyoxylase I family protein